MDDGSHGQTKSGLGRDFTKLIAGKKRFGDYL